MNGLTQPQVSEMKGVLAWIERSGNKLPDPVFIFVWCIAAIIVVSVVSALIGVNALHPTQVDSTGNALVINAESLLSPTNIQRPIGGNAHDIHQFSSPRLCAGRDAWSRCS